jgi:hypothetical protein
MLLSMRGHAVAVFILRDARKARASGMAHSHQSSVAETPREAPHFDLASAGIASAMNGHHRSLMARILDKIFRRFSSGISLFGFAKSSRLFSTFDQN